MRDNPLRNISGPFILAPVTAETVRDYTPYVRAARERRAKRQREAAARLDRAWDVAREIAAFLREKYQPTRIVAFGSMVHRVTFHLRSDIDIAVDGIPWPAYLRAWNDVEERFPEFKVDLIDVGIVSERMRQRIEEQGQAL